MSIKSVSRARFTQTFAVRVSPAVAARIREVADAQQKWVGELLREIVTREFSASTSQSEAKAR